MIRLLDGTEPAWRTDILGEHWGSAPIPGDLTPPIPTFALVRGTPWKYTEYCTGEVELYDLNQDPFELNNVASSNQWSAPYAAAAATRRMASRDPVPLWRVRRDEEDRSGRHEPSDRLASPRRLKPAPTSGIGLRVAKARCRTSCKVALTGALPVP
jgi:hypothetical protein